MILNIHFNISSGKTLWPYFLKAREQQSSHQKVFLRQNGKFRFQGVILSHSKTLLGILFNLICRISQRGYLVLHLMYSYFYQTGIISLSGLALTFVWTQCSYLMKISHNGLHMRKILSAL
jgi:hypothetical protein